MVVPNLTLYFSVCCTISFNLYFTLKHSNIKFISVCACESIYILLCSVIMDSESQWMPPYSQHTVSNSNPQTHSNNASHSVPRTGSTKRTHNPRRVWTLHEEHELMVGLKGLVASAMKCDNGFRTGYLPALEQHMNSRFPGTDLKADPHILSKIHVWRRQYGSLNTMLSRSGFGWNDQLCQIVVEDDIWKVYVTVSSVAPL